MNTEFEVKNILRMNMNPEKRARFISEFTTFKEEDVIKAIKKGGETPADIYRNLVNLSRKAK